MSQNNENGIITEFYHNNLGLYVQTEASVKTFQSCLLVPYFKDNFETFVQKKIILNIPYLLNTKPP